MKVLCEKYNNCTVPSCAYKEFHNWELMKKTKELLEDLDYIRNEYTEMATSICNLKHTELSFLQRRALLVHIYLRETNKIH